MYVVEGRPDEHSHHHQQEEHHGSRLQRSVRLAGPFHEVGDRNRHPGSEGGENHPGVYHPRAPTTYGRALIARRAGRPATSGVPTPRSPSDRGSARSPKASSGWVRGRSPRRPRRPRVVDIGTPSEERVRAPKETRVPQPPKTTKRRTPPVVRCRTPPPPHPRGVVGPTGRASRPPTGGRPEVRDRPGWKRRRGTTHAPNEGRGPRTPRILRPASARSAS